MADSYPAAELEETRAKARGVLRALGSDVIGRRLVNGVEAGAVAADDRGLQYGDGLFETMAVLDGRIRAFALHMARLEGGCARLGIPMPERACSRRSASRCSKVLAPPSSSSS